MERELWFNKAGNTGRPMANPDKGPTRSPDNNINNGNNQVAPLVCNRCNGGYPVSNMFGVAIGKEYTCPEGWTMEKDPCKKNDDTPVVGTPVVGTPVDGGKPASEEMDIMTYLPYIGIAIFGYLILNNYE
jgi:hypothetical protein